MRLLQVAFQTQEAVTSSLALLESGESGLGKISEAKDLTQFRPMGL